MEIKVRRHGLFVPASQRLLASRGGPFGSYLNLWHFEMCSSARLPLMHLDGIRAIQWLLQHTQDLSVKAVMETPFDEIVEQLGTERIKGLIGSVIVRLETINEAHECMDEDRAGRQIVVLMEEM